MFIPLSADGEGRKVLPQMTIFLILLNVMVFIVLQESDANSDFTMAFSTVPKEIISNKDIVTPDDSIYDPYTDQEYFIPGLKETPIPVRWTLLTSMFMHVGWMHLIGNMLYLWVFGASIEDELGHFRFLGFYLAAGLAADLGHVAASAEGVNSLIPTLGASGAISGVIGAFLIGHADRRIKILILMLFYQRIVEMPAVIAIFIWYAMQMLGGLSSMDHEGSGVAYVAHIVGFISGGVLIWAFRPDDPNAITKEQRQQEAEEQAKRAEEVVGIHDWRTMVPTPDE